MQKPQNLLTVGASDKNSINSDYSKTHYNCQASLKKCLECGDNTRLNVVKNPRGVLWLRCGICDLALRRCPDPSALTQSPDLTTEEREYCSRVACLSWFGGSVAAVLLILEAKAGEGMNHG